MKTDSLAPSACGWTAAALRQLSPDRCDAVLQSAAATAEEAYRNDVELTDFEAFGPDELHGGSASTETR